MLWYISCICCRYFKQTFFLWFEVFIFRGGSRIFFRRVCTRLLLYFNTNKPHSFFFGRIPVVLENCRSSPGKGGAHPQHPPPRSTPDMYWVFDFACLNIAIFCNHEKSQIKDPRNKVPIRYVYMFCNRFCPKKLPVTLKIVWNNFIFLNYAFFVVSYFVILKFHWKYPLTLQNKSKIHLFS